MVGLGIRLHKLSFFLILIEMSEGQRQSCKVAMAGAECMLSCILFGTHFYIIQFCLMTVVFQFQTIFYRETFINIVNMPFCWSLTDTGFSNQYMDKYHTIFLALFFLDTQASLKLTLSLDPLYFCMLRIMKKICMEQDILHLHQMAECHG